MIAVAARMCLIRPSASGTVARYRSEYQVVRSQQNRCQ
jgi:hypothetical protein